MKEPVANYVEGIKFSDLNEGDTVYVGKVENGFSTSRLIQITEIINDKKVQGVVRRSSWNGNDWETATGQETITATIKNAYLIDEKGKHHRFDAMGRCEKGYEEALPTRHPSYGMIRMSRFSGGHNVYFGSSITHGGGITVEISTAEVKRELSGDWYHPDTPFISVDMSYSQFAEMITTGMNTQGTPCTIRHRDGKKVERCEFTNKRQQFQEEFSDKMEDLKGRINTLVEDSRKLLSGAKAPNKSERELILGEIDSAVGMLTDHFTFLDKQWNRQLEKTTMEAKAEIEGFYETKIRDLGVTALENMSVPMIEGDVDE